MPKELDPGALAAAKARLSDTDINNIVAYDPPSRLGMSGPALEARKARDLKHSKVEQHCRAAIFWIRHTLPAHSELRADLIDKVRYLQTSWDAAIEETGP